MVLSAAVDTIGKIIMLRPLLVRLTTLTFAAIAVAGVAPATANADTSSADVTGFTTKNITVSSQGCHYVPVTMHMTTDSDFSNEMIDTTTHIYRGGVERDYNWFEPNVGGSWLWCDYLDGLGTFTLGPTDVNVSFFDYTGDVNTTDSTLGHVKVKLASRAAVNTITKSGRYVTLTGRATHYSYDAARFVAWRGVRMYFDYRLPGSTTWHTATSTLADQTGNATKRIYEGSSRYWRVSTHEAGTVWGAASASSSRR